MPQATVEWEQGIAEYGEVEWKVLQEKKAVEMRGFFTTHYDGEDIDLYGLKKEE
jgi:hypothetical protein